MARDAVLHPCLICLPRSAAGQVVPLAFGHQVVLCDEHRAAEFVSGPAFVEVVSARLRALGIENRRWQEALRRLTRQVAEGRHPGERPRPGSYAWPGLRRAAEAAWAKGADFDVGVLQAEELARSEAPVYGPSRATFRRWWRERRWLVFPRQEKRSVPPPPPPPPVPSATGSSDFQPSSHLPLRALLRRFFVSPSPRPP